MPQKHGFFLSRSLRSLTHALTWSPHPPPPVDGPTGGQIHVAYLGSTQPDPAGSGSTIHPINQELVVLLVPHSEILHRFSKIKDNLSKVVARISS